MSMLLTSTQQTRKQSLSLSLPLLGLHVNEHNKRAKPQGEREKQNTEH